MIISLYVKKVLSLYVNKLFILKTKKREVLTPQYEKELFTFNIFSKNKQNSKVFSSSDLTLLFYRVYLCFILDQRRTKNKHNCACFKLYSSSFLLTTDIFHFIIFKRLYHTSFKLNIMNFSWALHPCPPLNPLMASQCTHSASKVHAVFYYPIHAKRRICFLPG